MNFDHKHKFSLTHLAHFSYLSDGLNFTNKPSDSQPKCTLRCATAEWRITTNPISHMFFFWEVGIVYCTCDKCMQPSERNRQLTKARYDVLSIPSYVKKKPTRGARHGPSMRQYMYYKAHEMLKKAHKHDYKNILDRWYQDDKYRKSLSDIRWNEEGIMQYDKIASEDHSYTATREEGSQGNSH